MEKNQVLPNSVIIGIALRVFSIIKGCYGIGIFWSSLFGGSPFYG